MRIGEIFRYPYEKIREEEELDGYPNFSFHTDYPAGNFVLLDRGINSIGKVRHGETTRTPAILISSSPHKIGSSETPWQDHYNVERGHIRYFGDNKSPGAPESKTGNKALLEQFEIHNSSDPNIRREACPIIFFRRVPVKGKQKGYVEFNGFGIVTNARRVVQHSKNSKDFVNYCFDFAVLEMMSENENFNWEWVNARRNKDVSLEETLKTSPMSWKKWIKEGNAALGKLTRNVYAINVASMASQRPEKGSREDRTLKKIYEFYDSRKTRFEHLASIVAEHNINKSTQGYRQGWVTKGVGDKGIDFVGRLDLGFGFGVAKVIVLGQAKCEALDTPTGGNHIARTVAKLKRGWLGVYVTTSYFSLQVQREILEDKYPLLLINGKQLAQEVNEIVHDQGYKNVEDYLKKIDGEYTGAIQYKDPEQILYDL